MSALTGPVPTLDRVKPPGAEIGAETQPVGGVNGWTSFVDESEFVPELSFPQSVRTYHRMRSDSQVDALHLGTMQPVREFRWAVDPNGAGAKISEQLASDLGLPILGHEDDPIERGPRLFDFDAFLDDVLLGPLYGFMFHEIVGSVRDDGWHIDKLAPRHPRTIQQLWPAPTGELLGIQQSFAGGQGGWFRLPPVIPATKLLHFVWRSEGGSHVGRSLLRSIYREWLVKDRTIRVAAINLERGGGVPAIEGPLGASDKQLADLAQLARQFKVAEGGGGAIPFGSKLTLVGGHVPDAISLLKYCDECMARVWSLMLVQLGMTTTGNRALGSEFALYAARAQRSFAKWVCRTMNRLFDDYVEYNLGPSARKAPLLHYEQAKPDSMSVTDFVSLVEVGAISVDPELESWFRSENGLPPASKPQSDPALGDLSPQEVQLVQNSRTPPELPSPQLPSSTLDPTAQDPTLASGRRVARVVAASSGLLLPDRQLRRQPYVQEVRAGVNYRQLDQAHADMVAGLDLTFKGEIIPAQIRALGEQVVTTQAGTPRQRLTKASMAGIQAPALGQDQIHSHLHQAARQGATAALAELSAQGVQADEPDDGTLDKAVSDQSAAVAAVVATGLSSSAQRRAASLVGGGRTPEALRADLEGYLSGLSHAWTLDQLQGAVTFAQNAGRIATFQSADQSALRYYASEILDLATCSECIAVDGTEYGDLQAAEQDYSSGGFNDCAGGPRCRGTLVAVSGESDASYQQGLVDPGAQLVEV